MQPRLAQRRPGCGLARWELSLPSLSPLRGASDFPHSGHTPSLRSAAHTLRGRQDVRCPHFTDEETEASLGRWSLATQ